VCLETTAVVGGNGTNTPSAIPFTPNISWPHDTYSFCLIILIGVFGFIAQMLLTFGLQREKAGRGSLAMYLQLFFTVFLEFLVFHLVPSFLSFVGTGIILSSAAWVAVDSLKASPPPVLPDPERYSHSDAGGSERDPISRTSSPVPPPGSKTVRGELYLYSALRGDDDQPTGSSSATLNVSSRTSTPVKKEEA
jgi:hypothetical protein